MDLSPGLPESAPKRRRIIVDDDDSDADSNPDRLIDDGEIMEEDEEGEDLLETWQAYVTF